MRKVLKDNSEVAYYWANQLQPEGRNANSSMSFNGDTIYSYALPIGKLMAGGRALIRRPNSSVTTNGKHIPEVRNAIPDHLHCYVHSIGLDRYGSSLRNNHWVHGECEAIRLDFQATMLAFGRAKKESMKSIYYKSCQDIILNTRILADIVSNIDEVDVTPFDNLVQHLETLMQDLEHSAFDFLKNQKAREAKERKARQEKQKEVIERWKSFDIEIGNTLYGIAETYLRLLDCGDVHTSRNVTIPQSEAKLACKLFKSGRLLGNKLAGFTITQVDSVKKVVIAGCHIVPFSEIEQICSKLEEV